MRRVGLTTTTAAELRGTTMGNTRMKTIMRGNTRMNTRTMGGMERRIIGGGGGGGKINERERERERKLRYTPLHSAQCFPTNPYVPLINPAVP